MIPNIPSEEFEKANSFLKDGSYQEALDIYDKLIEVHRSGDDFDFNFIVDQYKIFSNKGIALKKLGRYVEAVDAFTLALEYGGRFVPSVFRMRAEAHQLSGNTEAAIVDLESSLKSDSDSNVGLWNIVCYSALKGDMNRVEKYLRRFAECYPHEKEDLLNDSDLQLVQDEPEFKRIVAELWHGN